MKGALGNMLKQAQQMQENLREAQEELAKKEFTGEAGGGLVKVTLNGKYAATNVTLDPITADDTEMLEDLIAAAINDASNKVAEANQALMGNLTGGMNLPEGFKMPF